MDNFYFKMHINLCRKASLRKTAGKFVFVDLYLNMSLRLKLA